jgi:hypothetical protein
LPAVEAHDGAVDIDRAISNSGIVSFLGRPPRPSPRCSTASTNSTSIIQHYDSLPEPTAITATSTEGRRSYGSIK